MKATLFVYGGLKPGHEPPLTMSEYYPDTVRGDLYDLGNDAAAVNIGSSPFGRIRGITMEIDESELPRLDKMEKPEFRRIRTQTMSGTPVWIYEYRKAIPAKAPRIESWPVPSKATV